MTQPYVSYGYWQSGYAEGDPVYASVALTGIEATSSIGSVPFKINESGGTISKKNPRKLKNAFWIDSEYIELKKVDDVVQLNGIASFGSVGKIKCFGAISANVNVQQIDVSSNSSKIRAIGIINPTEEEMMLLLAA